MKKKKKGGAMCSYLLPPRMRKVGDKNIEMMTTGDCMLAVTGEIFDLLALLRTLGHDLFWERKTIHHDCLKFLKKSPANIYKTVSFKGLGWRNCEARMVWKLQVSPYSMQG